MLLLEYFFKFTKLNSKKKKGLHCPGIEPGSKAWKALMITTTLAVLLFILPKEAFAIKLTSTL